MRRRLGMFASTLVLVAMMSAVVAGPALAGSRNGSVSCGGTRTVIIQSRASVNISHSWKSGGYQPFYNPYRTLKTSYTPYQSTWWVVDYDFEITSAGGSCTQ